MNTLIEYLKEKAGALRTREKRISAGELGAKEMSAQVTAEGRSGIRRIRIRDFQIVTDAPADFAGYNLGPSAPELLLGSLGSCLVHTLMIQAAWLDIPIETADVVVTGGFDPRTGHPAFADAPVGIQNISYVFRIASSATEDELTQLHGRVSQFCPILNALRLPPPAHGRVERV